MNTDTNRLARELKAQAICALADRIEDVKGSRILVSTDAAAALREAAEALRAAPPAQVVPEDVLRGKYKDPTGFSADLVEDEAKNWTRRHTGKQMLLNYAKLLRALAARGAQD